MVGKKTIEEFAWNQTDLENAKKKVGSGYQVSRYKGLGEMNADQLWVTTMDPNHRKLIKLTINDANIASKYVELFMGKDPSGRNTWIKENVDFSTKGDFFAEEVKNNG